MFWSNPYIHFLEAEVKRLQEIERILLSAQLERAGHREAAHMLRGDNPEARQAAMSVVPKQEQAPKTPPDRNNWRATAQWLSEQTRPKVYESSGQALEAKVKEQTQ